MEQRVSFGEFPPAAKVILTAYVIGPRSVGEVLKRLQEIADELMPDVSNESEGVGVAEIQRPGYEHVLCVSVQAFGNVPIAVAMSALEDAKDGIEKTALGLPNHKVVGPGSAQAIEEMRKRRAN